MQTVLAILIGIHGLITAAIGAGTMSGAPTTPDMGKLPGVAWYPVPLGESWLLRGGVAQFGGALWIAAGIGLVLTAASVSGLVMPGAWRQIGLVSGTLGLIGLALFFHPYYVLAIAADLAIVAAATIMEPTTRRLLGF
ncbi:MAG TPA: hypothetical protein VJP45_07305 [Candidatus Limnocylindria bacterium]|nr:hypothetical protein [Candidatus Limnocylindria bacterium]